MKNLISMTLITIFSCSSPKPIIENEIKYITFGNGGGFVGIETKYMLKTDGTLSKISKKDTTIIKSIDKAQAAILLKEIAPFKVYKYNKPDNIYQFIEIQNNRIVWGTNDNLLNKKIISLYTKLFTLLK